MKAFICALVAILLFNNESFSQKKPPQEVFQMPVNEQGIPQFIDNVTLGDNYSSSVITAKIREWASQKFEHAIDINTETGDMMTKGVIMFPVPLKVNTGHEIIDYEIDYKLTIDTHDGRYLATLNDFWVRAVANKSTDKATYRTSLKGHSPTVEEVYNELLEKVGMRVNDKTKMKQAERWSDHMRMLYKHIDFKSRELLTSLKNAVQK